MASAKRGRETAWRMPLVQILVLVAITRVGLLAPTNVVPIGTLRTEVENGSVSIAVRHGLVDTKVSGNS